MAFARQVFAGLWVQVFMARTVSIISGAVEHTL
jgi:hypothetical protein